MKTWDEMTDDEKSTALAEKLGWRFSMARLQWLTSNGSWVSSDWTPFTWDSMGLVVDAMAEKGYKRGLYHYDNGEVQAYFRGPGGFGQASSEDHNEPAVVALAAFRALGGE